MSVVKQNLSEIGQCMSEGSIFPPFHTLGDLIFYLYTKFGEDTLIDGGDIPLCHQN